MTCLLRLKKKKIFVRAGRGVVTMTEEKTMIEEMILRVAEKRNKFFFLLLLFFRLLKLCFKLNSTFTFRDS